MKRVVIPDAVRAGNWCKLSPVAIPEERWHQFCTRRTAVTMYIEGYTERAISRKTGIKGPEVHRLLVRFLTLDDHGQAMGERALVPHARLKSYERTASLDDHHHGAHGGLSGCLGKLLATFPEIERKLLDVLQDHAQRLEEKTNVQAFLIQKFMNALRQAAPDYQGWPYTTKHLGRNSIRDYVLQLCDQNAAAFINAHGSPEARAHLATGTGHRPYLSAGRPFDIVELDGHLLEAIITLLVEQVDGLVKAVPLDRMWLLTMIETYSEAVLAYKLVLHSQPTAGDVREVIAGACLGGWTPRALENERYRYVPGAGFPSSVIEGCRGVTFAALSVDSHLSNIANKITLQARQDFGFHHLLGPIGRFETRNHIERLFREVARETSQIPSTTGSHPHKGRADKADEKAIRYQIDLKRFLDALDVALANYNVQQSEGIGMFSPLELLEQYTLQGALFPQVDPDRQVRLMTDLITKEVTVRGSRREGRRPYIQLDRVRYTNEVLAANFDLIGQKLLIEIDEHDYRVVKAYLSSGDYLGVLVAGGWWSGFPHTCYMRRLVNSEIRNGGLCIDPIGNPVQQISDYFVHLNQPDLALLVRQGAAPTTTALPQMERTAPMSVKDYFIQPERDYPGLPTPGRADNRGES